MHSVRIYSLNYNNVLDNCYKWIDIKILQYLFYFFILKDKLFYISILYFIQMLDKKKFIISFQLQKLYKLKESSSV